MITISFTNSQNEVGQWQLRQVYRILLVYIDSDSYAYFLKGKEYLNQRLPTLNAQVTCNLGLNCGVHDEIFQLHLKEGLQKYVYSAVFTFSQN